MPIAQDYEGAKAYATRITEDLDRDELSGIHPTRSQVLLFWNLINSLELDSV